MTDKHYPSEFWQWLAGLTKDFGYSKLLNSPVLNIHNIMDAELHKEIQHNILESSIYQAIDGYNEKYPETYTQDFYCPGITLKGYEKYFYWCDYPTKTAARLDALHWVWERSK